MIDFQNFYDEKLGAINVSDSKVVSAKSNLDDASQKLTQRKENTTIKRLMLSV